MRDFEANKILNIIKNHKGKSNPIKVNQLKEILQLSDRDIRKIVSYLVNEKEEPIGSTTKGPHGFYIIINQEDYFEAIGNLFSRREKIAERIEALRETCLKQGLDVPDVEIITDKKRVIFNINNSIVINVK